MRSAFLVAGLVLACGGETNTDSGGSQTGGAGGVAGSGGSPGGTGGVISSGGAGGGIPVDAGRAPDPCPAGTKRCGDVCRSTTDPAYGCASESCETCEVSHAEVNCALNGVCHIVVCDFGFGDCDGLTEDGCETLVSSDPQNCGACGTACDVAAVCMNGSCACSCPAGLVQCGGENCLCVNVASDPNHCSACFSACPAGKACVAGICT